MHFQKQFRLERWSVVSVRYKRIAPEDVSVKKKSRLCGILKGGNLCSFIHEGDKMMTTPIVGKRNNQVVTSSGEEYTLGKPSKSYAEKHPKAQEDLLSNLKKV